MKRGTKIALGVGGGLILLAALGSLVDETEQPSQTATTIEEAEPTERPAQTATTVEEEEPKEQRAPPVTAADLWAAYDKNQIAADNTYKDKYIQVIGIVGSVGKDILDDPYITLEAGNLGGSVQCMLAQGEASEAAGLSKGQAVALRGKVDGKLMSVLLRDCTILVVQ